MPLNQCKKQLLLNYVIHHVIYLPFLNTNSDTYLLVMTSKYIQRIKHQLAGRILEFLVKKYIVNEENGNLKWTINWDTLYNIYWQCHRKLNHFPFPSISKILMSSKTPLSFYPWAHLPKYNIAKFCLLFCLELYVLFI